MTYGVSEECSCKACDKQFPHYKKLSEHIKKEHRLDPEDYYVKYFYNGNRPTCILCKNKTRYVSLSEGFKKYCIDHKKVAMKESGKLGGKIKKTWNKGKTKENDDRILKLANFMTGVNNPFYGKKHSEETKRKNAEKSKLLYTTVLSRISQDHKHISVLSNNSEYKDQYSLLTIKCDICHTQDHVSLFNLKRCWRCKKCNPSGSKQQLEISDFVKSLGFKIIDSTKKVIPPLELDVWVPDKSLAIEYHGLYWHSGGRDDIFDKGRHRKKYELCRDNGIKLIQIFSDEWREKTDICKSIIRNALRVNTIKLNARDCVIVELSTDDAKEFLNQNHISGYTRCRHKFGLVHKQHGLVGIATTRVPIQGKWGKLLELARMSFLRDVSVRGGASKLLTKIKAAAIESDFDGVLSYADLRFGDGGVYEKCEFQLVGESKTNYWYTDGHERFDRFSFRAKPGISEKQVVENAGVRPIWGSGNRIYVWKPNCK